MLYPFSFDDLYLLTRVWEIVGKGRRTKNGLAYDVHACLCVQYKWELLIKVDHKLA